MKQVFYFSPHQDDEVTNFGAAICADIEQGHEVFCVLCTDGGASCARELLAGQSVCAWHSGSHAIDLTREAFSAARDREFKASCLALGLKPENILISPLCAPDSGCSADAAQQIILDATAGFAPEQTVIKTIFPTPWQHQNPDHAAIAQAAGALFAKRRFAGLEYYYEMILLPAPDDVALQKIVPSPEGKKRLLLAAAAYGLWEPEHGRYAVGYHSVYDEFQAYVREPCAWLVKTMI